MSCKVLTRYYLSVCGVCCHGRCVGGVFDIDLEGAGLGVFVPFRLEMSQSGHVGIVVYFLIFDDKETDALFLQRGNGRGLFLVTCD